MPVLSYPIILIGAVKGITKKEGCGLVIFIRCSGGCFCRIARWLRFSRDGLVMYPTETIYGLGADALSETAVYKVYEAKQRPMGKPVSVAVSDPGR